MLKTIIILPDGTEISSGTGTVNAIKSSTLTECVNSGDELTLGSTCANALEATLITPSGSLSLEAGTEVAVCKENGSVRTQIGIFILEKPTRPTANTMKITGYDRVSKLDKDLTAWLSGLSEWPYTLTTFANMVCTACGLTFKVTDVPNGDFPVYQFTRSAVTGRQIMRWLGEICCRFCRATADGDIEFAWYKPSDFSISASGDLYFFLDGLSYEDYETAPIKAVQVRLADSENGVLWPEAEEGANCYVISGNPVLNVRITDGLEPVLTNIKNVLADVVYTPCKVNIPANLNLRAGDIARITDKNGKTITSYVMTKTQTGQKDILECTGSRRRDSATAVNNQSQSASADKALDNMTQEQLFKKLTKDGQLQGLFMKDGVMYVNVSYLMGGEINADLIDVESLFAKNITMTGKFESTVDAYLPPTYDDAIRTLRALVYPDKYQLPEEYDFDLNGDGVFDEDDAIAAIRVATGYQSMTMKDLPGAVKTPVTIRIDMSDLEKTIHIFGTNMWGTYVETYIGADVNNSSFASRAYLDRMITIDPDPNESAQSLYRMVDDEKEYFNPPMEVGVEYRTIERYQGKPVYTKLIDCGALPASSSKWVSVGSTKVIYFYGMAVKTDGTTVQFPVISSSGAVLARANLSGQAFYIVTFSDMSTYNAYFIVKYTKE